MTPPDELAPRSASAGPLARLTAAFALPLALYFILRPEGFGLTPNPLDPFFYAGYAVNFDDIVAVIGDDHYSVSRWSAYLPGYVSTTLFGPVLGRLVLRLCLAALVLGSVWRLGGRRWTWGQRLLIGTLVITMPMFVRALFTDYVEYLVVGLGIPLVVISLRERQTALTAAVAGGLASLCVIANPVAVTMVLLPLAFCVLFGARGVRNRLAIGSIIIVAGAAVAASGAVLFRWRYGIDNVYQPTLDYFGERAGADLLKSPRRDWLRRFTWLFATPTILLFAVASAWRRSLRFDRVEAAALLLCGGQYGYQWIDQFVRGGNGLEVPYYWSFSYPTFAVALTLIVAKLTKNAGNSPMIGLTAAWVAWLLIGVPDALRLPSGAWFLVVAAAVAIGATLLSSDHPTAAAVVAIVFVGWTQIGAPSYDPSAYHPFNVSPNYDDLFNQSGAETALVYDETLWFETQMDQVPNDRDASFVNLGGWSSPITGIYGAHVADRLVDVDETGVRLSPPAIAQVLGGQRPLLALFGPPERVAALIETFPTDLGVGSPVFDATHDSALGYRLAVFSMPDERTYPFTWPGDAFQRLVGDIRDHQVVAEEGAPAGYVTFGPYVELSPGTYHAELHYSSLLDPGRSAGSFEIVSSARGVASAAQLQGTNGQASFVTVSFSVADSTDTWQFRTLWTGEGTFIVERVTLTNS